MIIPQKKDAPHKFQMYRLLTAIIEDTELSKNLVFKGGTCAALRGWLDRFSVDLDFDLKDKNKINTFRNKIRQITKSLGFSIKDESTHHLQFFLKYKAPTLARNTLKLEINDDVSPYNQTEIANLAEINLMAQTQTLSTMVSNKLVAAINRFKAHGTIAGRDFYDIRHFLSQGYEINKQVIEERTNMSFSAYISKLINFIETTVADKDLYEDINPLLPAKGLKKSTQSIRKELLILLPQII